MKSTANSSVLNSNPVHSASTGRGTPIMTSRERVLAAARHQPVDRAPSRFNCGSEAKRIAQGLGMDLSGDWLERLHQRFAIDMRILDLQLVEGVTYDGDWRNLAGAETAADVDRLWPAKWLAENRTIEPARAQIAAWDAAGTAPAVQVRLTSIFTLYVRMRGETEAFMDLADENEVIVHAMDRNEEFMATMIDKAFDTLGDRLDIVYIGEELGMQTGLMYSPATIRKHFLTRLNRLFDRIHKRGGLVFYHSCGAIEPMIQDLIDIGVDILHPIQPKLTGMEPEHLAEKFGGRVGFCGGIDMQKLLPTGSPEEVSAEVEHYVKSLGSGYIIDSANILHPDIPVANIAAIFDAPRS